MVKRVLGLNCSSETSFKLPQHLTGLSDNSHIMLIINIYLELMEMSRVVKNNTKMLYEFI